MEQLRGTGLPNDKPLDQKTFIHPVTPGHLFHQKNQFILPPYKTAQHTSTTSPHLNP